MGVGSSHVFTHSKSQRNSFQENLSSWGGGGQKVKICKRTAPNNETKRKSRGLARTLLLFVLTWEKKFKILFSSISSSSEAINYRLDSDMPIDDNIPENSLIIDPKYPQMYRWENEKEIQQVFFFLGHFSFIADFNLLLKTGQTIIR